MQYRALLEAHGALSAEQIEAQVRFRELVLAENAVQNLTRLVSPADFFEGHFLDAWELVKTGWIQEKAMDLGSGLGVPGLPAALLGRGSWVLADSEGRKADFLERASSDLGVSSQVQVFKGRAEEFLKRERVESIVARAVGPVSRIFSWIAPCSTWNTLILLKSRGWADEWGSLESKKARSHFLEPEFHEYSVGADQKYMVLVKLTRKGR